MPITSETSSSQIDLDVIIIGFNSAATLPDCIHAAQEASQHLQETNGLHARIAYVDSFYSTDNSRHIAAGQGLDTFVDHPDYRTASNARMSGFFLTNAPYVMFVDSDCTLDKSWLEKGMAFLKAHPEAGAVAGICDVARRIGKRTVRIPNIAQVTQIRPMQYTYTGSGSLLAFRDAISKAGGYEPDLMPLDDVYLIANLQENNREVFLIPERMETHWNSHLDNQYLGFAKLRHILLFGAPRVAAAVRQSLSIGKIWKRLFPYLRYELLHGLLLLLIVPSVLLYIFSPNLQGPLVLFGMLFAFAYTAFHICRKRDLVLGLISLVTMSIYAGAIVCTFLTNRPKLRWGVQKSISYIKTIEKINSDGS